MQTHIKSDFNEEVMFGIRYEPSQVTQKFNGQYSLLLYVAPEIGNIEIDEVFFFGNEEIIEDPRKLTRSNSVRVETTSRPKLGRSVSLVEDGETSGASTDNSQRNKKGNVTKTQFKDLPCILLNFTPDYFSGNFFPTELVFKVKKSKDDYLSIQVKLSNYHIMFGALFNRLNKKKLQAVQVYETFVYALIPALKTLGVANYPVLTWSHGALLSFIHSISYDIGKRVIDQSTILAALALFYKNKIIDSILAIIAIGHAIGTLTSSESSITLRPKIQLLWNIPRDLLVEAKDKMDVLDNLAVRAALAFLFKEDSSKTTPPQSFSSFSGVLPLMVRLKFMDNNDLKKIEYATVSDPTLKKWKSNINEIVSAISNVNKQKNKRLDFYIDTINNLAEKMDGFSNQLFELLATQNENSIKASKVWRCSREIVFFGKDKQEQLNLLCDDILPKDPTIRERMMEELTIDFENSLCVWKLIEKGSQLKSGKSRDELEIFNNQIELSGNVFARISTSLEVLKQTLTNFSGLTKDVYSYKHVDMKKSLFSSLNEIETIFQNDYDQKNIDGGFNGIFPDVPFADRALLECPEVITTFPLQTSESKDGFTLLATDSHLIRQINKANTNSRQIVAGSLEAGRAVGTKVISRLCEPRGLCFCPIKATADQTVPPQPNQTKQTFVTVIADTGNNCVRGVLLNDKNVFTEEVFAIAGTGEPGFKDGSGDHALFNSPSGLVMFGNDVILCDTGNHVIRKLRMSETNNKSWIVSTIVGSPENAGIVDGSHLDARLTSPYQAVLSADQSCLYFTEQSTNPSVRCCLFNEGKTELSMVITIHRGDPFIHLNGLCLGENNCLMVCDSGAGCIWSVDVTTKQVMAKITSEHIFQLSAQISDDLQHRVKKNRLPISSSSSQTTSSSIGANDKQKEEPKLAFSDSFAPLCIVHLSHIAPGYYIFSDKNTKHMLFKHFDSRIVTNERQHMTTMYKEIVNAKNDVVAATVNFVEMVNGALNYISETSSVPFNLKSEAIEENYISEIKELDTVVNRLDNNPQTKLPFQLYVGMLANAPTLQAAAVLAKVIFENLERRRRMESEMGMRGLGGLMGMGGMDDMDMMGGMMGGMGGMMRGMGGGMGHMGRRRGGLDELEDEELFMGREQSDAQECLSLFLGRRDFAAPHIDRQVEIGSLLNIVKIMPDGLQRQLVVASALKNATFTFELSTTVLDILAHGLGFVPSSREKEQGMGLMGMGLGLGMGRHRDRTRGGGDRDGARLLKEPALVWVKRLLPHPDNFIELSFEAFVKHALNYWTDFLNKIVGVSFNSDLNWDDEIANQMDMDDDDDEGGEKANRAAALFNMNFGKKKNSSKEELLKKTWKWLVSLYFEDLCVGKAVVGRTVSKNKKKKLSFEDITIDKSEKFLEILPVLCSSSTTFVHDVVAAICSSVASKYVGPTKSMQSLLKALTSNTLRLEGKILNSFYNVFQNIANTLSVKALNELMDSKANNLSTDLPYWQFQFRLLTVHSGFWAKLIDWFYNPIYVGSHIQGKSFDSLKNYIFWLLRLAKNLSFAIVRGHVNQDILKGVVESYNDLAPVWSKVNSPLGDRAFVSDLQREMDSCLNESNTLSKIMLSLMPECEELKYLNNVINSWNTYPIAAIRGLLLLPQHEDYLLPTEFFVLFNDDAMALNNLIAITPLPLILCKAIDWLELADKSDLFKRFWRDQCGIGNVSDISPVAGRWSGFLITLRDGTLEMNVLDRYGELLLNVNEVKIFVRTANSVRRAIEGYDNGEPPEKYVIYPDGDHRESSIVSEVSQIIHRWNHVQMFYVNKAYVEEVLAASLDHVADSQKYRISALKVALDSLCGLVDANGPWISQTMKTIEQYWPSAELLDRRLLKIPPMLLRKIEEKVDLINWLRTIRDDEVFASSIEMARSLQEMNAPIELWDSLSGRVNERFLSMISNIRNYLHAYLYDVSHLVESFDIYIKIFSELNAKTDPAQIISNINICYEVRSALSKIIGMKTDVSGSSRLAHLYSIECESFWRCSRLLSHNEPGTDGSVVLKYKTADSQKDEGFSWRQHLSGDLVDFQSNIVLERSLVGGKVQGDQNEDNHAVDNFLTQFSWMRRLSDVLLSLYNSGHFDFNPEYCFDIPVSLSEDVFRQRATDLEKERNEWEKHVNAIRTSHYFINFFDLKRCYTLLKALDEITNSQESQFDQDKKNLNLTNMIKNYICFLNPEVVHDDALIANVLNLLKESWKKSETMFIQTETEINSSSSKSNEMVVESSSGGQHKSSMVLLSRIAFSLDQSLSDIPRRSRKLNVPTIDQFVVNERINRGVHVAFGNPLKAQYDQLVTIAAIQKEFFEWENCLLCNKNTTFEQVALLFHRWHRSYQNKRDLVTYALVEVEKLSYEVQFSAVQLLRELGPSPSTSIGPLIFIAESGDNCYLAAQFQHNRINNGILPQSVLSEISIILSSYGSGLYCHTSRIPGAGKSFDIRLRAANENFEHVHIPINAAYTAADVLIKQMVNIVNPNQRNLLHFDVSSTVGSTLLSTIFSIAVIGVYADPETNLVFSYHPGKTCVCIELAPGMQFGHFSQFAFYPTIENVANAHSFHFNREVLERGMGHEFSAVLYGSLTAELSTHIPPSNAFDRLFFVLETLYQLDSHGGSFPYNFSMHDVMKRSSENNSSIQIPKEIAFELLMKATRLRKNASLWCVWSFINVLFWQLQEMQVETSPVFLACQPDISIQLMTLQFDTAMKERVKGEMINFIVKTAREFATRQASTKDEYSPDRVVGVIVKNLSWVPESKQKNINLLFWKRERFDNDGHPVFRSPDFHHNFTMGGVKQSDKCYHLYIHFRESENRWVIDDTVNYTGGVIAYSKDNRPLNTAVFEMRVLRGRDITVEVKKVGNKQGHKGEAVSVKGFANCPTGPGLVAGPDDDGIYLRVPEDINGQCHYVKNNPTRHLYFLAADKGRWVIAKTCNAEVLGACAYTRTETMESKQFVYYPPNTVENVTLKVVCAGEAVDVLTAECYSMAYQPENIDLTGLLDDTNPADVSPDMIGAQLESAGLSVELTRWKDSNHECVFFNNDTCTLSFLSLDAKVLEQNIHPVLLTHLQVQHKLWADIAKKKLPPAIAAPVVANRNVNQNNSLTQMFKETTVVEDLKNSDVNRYWEILSSTTGVHRTKKEVAEIFDESFCLTGDSLLKILAIVYRVKCKIPVVLLGECGCGKTMLLSFLCKWLGVQLLSLDVHGGTTEKEIIEVFDKAQSTLLFSNNPNSTVFVFLDEVNTCSHMGLLNEAICHRSIYGKRLMDGVQILAALNPYRLRPKKEEMGLTFNLGHNPVDDSMSRLVYRVHPIPPTLKDFIFDFGSLEPETELLYIQSMVANESKMLTILEGVASDDILVEERKLISMLIHKGQEYVRNTEGDPSVVSLRDVKRVLILIHWFFVEWPDEKRTGSQVTPCARSVVLALAHVYCYRLSSTASREGFWKMISQEVRSYKVPLDRFIALGVDDTPNTVVAHAQLMFVENLEVEEGISMNQALSENLFVSIVCILNKIPIFIVGKPGTSKTLALQVIQSNLQGRQSPKEYWQSKPSVHIFQYQCSPMSTSHSIKYMFEAAKSFQEHSTDVLTVLLLDEVGLAENSPDMPLKVLHYMLVDPPIAIVGLSNWALDSSKMNRAVCLQRPEPSEKDIQLTGKSIVTSSDYTQGEEGEAPKKNDTGKKGPGKMKRQLSRSSSMHSWLAPLGKAYLHIYTKQKDLLNSSRDFIGMRDYYSMLKFLRTEINYNLSPEVLTKAVARNFGGRPDSIPVLLPIFYEACFPNDKNDEVMDVDNDETFSVVNALKQENLPSTVSLVSDNLKSSSSRHLMVLSKNETVLNLLFGCGVIDEASVSVLVGSRFRDDLDELHLIQQINKVKQAMAEGKVAVLLNNENIYESLYDVLNQRYVRQRDSETGEERKLLRLAMGPRSQLCPVEKGFKLIVIVQQQHAYDHLDLPLLNRFEKQVLTPSDVLSAKAFHIVDSLQKWCNYLLTETGLPSLSSIFCGFYEETLSSLVLSLTNFCLLEDSKWKNDELLFKAKMLLLKVATPVAILHSKTLKTLISEYYNDTPSKDAFDRYFASRSHLFALLNSEVNSRNELQLNPADDEVGKLFLIATRSPVHHFEISLKNWVNKKKEIPSDQVNKNNWAYTLTDSDVVTMQLAHVTAERTLSTRIEQFYADPSEKAPSLLTILCDPLYCNMSLISHARYIAFQLYHAHKTKSTELRTKAQRHIMFVINLPPGVSSRLREFTLDIYPPWSYMFLDDLMAQEDIGGTDLMKLLKLNLFELCNNDMVNLTSIITKNFQSSLAQCSVMSLDDYQDPRGHITYVKMIQELLKCEPFLKYVHDCSLKCLETLHQVNDMEFHVFKACENIKGSLRQSLQLSIENIIVNALGHTLRSLDINYNLSWLFETYRDAHKVDLWLQLANHLQPPSAIAMRCGDDLSRPPKDIVIVNTGKRGPFACRFPFSEKLSALFSENYRSKVEQQVGEDLGRICKSLYTLVDSILEPSVSEMAYNLILGQNNIAYLYDFVASSIYPMQYLSFGIQFSFVKAAMDFIKVPEVATVYTPNIVHAKYWVIENGLRFFTTFSALSVLKSGQQLSEHELFIPRNLDEILVEKVQQLANDQPQLPLNDCLRNLDISVASIILGAFRDSIDAIFNNQVEVEGFTFYDLLSKWGNVFSLVQKDLETLVVLATGNKQNKHDNESNKFIPLEQQMTPECFTVLKLWWFLKSIRSFVTEFLNMFSPSNFQKDLFGNILNSFKNEANPTSVSSLQGFLNSSMRFPFQYPILAKCYIKKFLLPEIDMIGKVGYSIRISTDLLRLIATLLLSVNVNSLQFTSEIAKADYGQIETSLHRAAIDILYNYVKKGYQHEVNEILRDFFKMDFSSIVRIAQLYLERAENDEISILQNDVVETQNVLALTNAKDLGQIFHCIQNSGVDLLVNIAKLKLLIAKYSKKIYDHINSTSETSDIDFPTIPTVLAPFLKTFVESQLYSFTHVVHRGGKTSILAYLRRKKVPFMLPESTLIGQDSPLVKSIDPFSSLSGREVYMNACSVMVQVRKNKNIDALDKWSKETSKKVKKWSDKMLIILAATFTQITANLLELQLDVADRVTEWIHKDFLESSTTAGTNVNLFVDFMKYLLTSKQNKKDSLTNLESIQQNLKLHVCLIAMTSSSGWLHSLFTDPKSFKKVYIPGMVDSEMSMLLNIVDINGNIMNEVGWYECPNGHKYTVGNCTKPMEIAKCPSCGARIGGENHTAVSGVKRLGTDREMNQSVEGYSLDATGERKGYDIGRLGRLTTVLLRYVTHAVMLMNAEMYPSMSQEMTDARSGARSVVAELMYPKSNVSELPPSRIRRELSDRLKLDWNELKSILEMDDEDIAMGVHMILNNINGSTTKYQDDMSEYGKAKTDAEIAVELDMQFRNVKPVEKLKTLSMPPSNMSTQARVVFEQKMEIDIVNPIFASERSRNRIKQEKAKFENDNVDLQLQAHLGKWYYNIMEIGPPKDESAQALMTLWRFREVITFSEFERTFRIKGSNEKDFPVIAAVLKHERSLPKIKYAADILAWHGVIFKVFKPGSISREEANNITNEDVINMLPVEDQDNARNILERFCEAFNATISQPGNLRECADNIFIHNGEIDLAVTHGTEAPRKMAFETPIPFSIPNSLKNGNEFVDPRSLCTLFILDKLKDLQETVVDALLTSTTAKKNDGEDVDENAMDVVKIVKDEMYKIPLTTYLTPSTVVSRRLLAFDRDTHLMPSIYTYYKQQLDICYGDLLGFDLPSIESDLRDALLPSAQPFAVAVIEFSFQGEVSVSGALSMLGQKIRQEDLAPSLLNTIWEEVDTEHRLAVLTAQLDNCVAFIGTSGSQVQLSGDTKLASFIVDILMIDSAKWSEMTCTTINTSVCLKHLKSLLNGLYERKHDGNPFFDLPTDFQKPLLPKQMEDLKKCVTQAKDLSILVKALREFLMKLKETGFQFQNEIYPNLFYVGDGDLYDCDWYEQHFPQDIAIAHTLATYEFIKGMM